ncbi:hypothetical protein GGS21DRAFT_517303 [Xylaria nigripes]|nr:hypothetical protein GGS21DRAFT_517303 [Xylaria nigripes]
MLHFYLFLLEPCFVPYCQLRPQVSDLLNSFEMKQHGDHLNPWVWLSVQLCRATYTVPCSLISISHRSTSVPIYLETFTSFTSSSS